MDHGDFQQLGRRRAAAGGPAGAAPASTCRHRAGRSSAGCARRRPRPRARAWPLSWPLMSRRSSSAPPPRAIFGLRPRQHLRALEVIDQRDQRARRRRSPGRGRPGGFRAAGRRADQPAPRRVGGDRRRQHARDRRDRAVEAELAQHREVGQRVGREARPSPPAGRARSAGRSGCLPWADRPAPD